MGVVNDLTSSIRNVHCTFKKNFILGAIMVAQWVKATLASH